MITRKDLVNIDERFIDWLVRCNCEFDNPNLFKK